MRLGASLSLSFQLSLNIPCSRSMKSSSCTVRPSSVTVFFTIFLRRSCRPFSSSTSFQRPASSPTSSDPKKKLLIDSVCSTSSTLL